MCEVYSQCNGEVSRPAVRRSARTAGNDDEPSAKVPRIERTEEIPVLKFYRRTYETLPPGPVVHDEYGVDIMSSEFINVPPGARDFIQTDLSFGIPQVSEVPSLNAID